MRKRGKKELMFLIGIANSLGFCRFHEEIISFKSSHSFFYLFNSNSNIIFLQDSLGGNSRTVMIGKIRYLL